MNCYNFGIGLSLLLRSKVGCVRVFKMLIIDKILYKTIKYFNEPVATKTRKQVSILRVQVTLLVKLSSGIGADLIGCFQRKEIGPTNEKICILLIRFVTNLIA